MISKKSYRTLVLDPSSQSLILEKLQPDSPPAREVTAPRADPYSSEGKRGHSSDSIAQAGTLQPPGKKVRTRQQMPSVSSALPPKMQVVSMGTLEVAQRDPAARSPIQQAIASSKQLLDQGDDYEKLDKFLQQLPQEFGAKIAVHAAARNRVRSTLLLTQKYCHAGAGDLQDTYIEALVAGHEPLARKIFEKHLKQYTDDFALAAEVDVLDSSIVALMKS
jgi:hypothetical protein